jgi:integrase
MDELDAVLGAANPPIRAAVALAAFAGLRAGDVVRLTWSAYDGVAVQTVQDKTGAEVWVPAHQRLRAILAETPRCTAVQIVTGQRGLPLTLAGFKANFFALIRRLRRDGVLSRRLTFHGLRHTAATMLAEAGCDDRDIMAVTGHKTPAMVHRYTEKADRRRRAEGAIDRLERTNTGRGEGKP